MKIMKMCTLTLGNDASTCCLTSQTRRSDGNCKHLYTFSSGTWIRTNSQPSRGSGGGSSSKPIASIVGGYMYDIAALS